MVRIEIRWGDRGRGADTEVIQAEYAHVRDACLVYAERGKRETVHYRPVTGLSPFTITTEPPAVGKAAVGDTETSGRPVPAGVAGLLGVAADRSGVPLAESPTGTRRLPAGEQDGHAYGPHGLRYH